MSPHGAASKAWHGLHPMLRAGLTSGTIMAGGDLLCQTIQMQYQPAVAGTAENEKVEKPKKCESALLPPPPPGRTGCRRRSARSLDLLIMISCEPPGSSAWV